MRLIGGRDYYDGCQAIGQDDLIFFRDRIEETREPAPIPFDTDDMVFTCPKGRTRTLSLSSPGVGEPVRNYTAHMSDYTARVLVVFFCGRCYLGMKIRAHRTLETHHVWDVPQAEAFLTKEFAAPFHLKRQRGIGFGHQPQFDRIASDFLNDRRASIAIFTSEQRWDRKRSCRIDATGLEEIGFARLLDPFSAYQELTMWVGNLGQTSREMVVISDEEKVRKHGFDKWSFRKMPNG